MQRILFVLLMCLLFMHCQPVHAVGLPPGTTIELVATGQYSNDQGDGLEATPASVILTVVQCAGVTLDWDIACDEIAQNTDVYFPVRIINTGNDTDTFDLTAVSENGWTTELIYDDNNDGIHQDSETWAITEAGPIAVQGVVDYYCPCFAKISIPDGATEADTVTITAISQFNASQGTGSTTIHVPAPGLRATKLEADGDPSPAYAGQTVTVSGILTPAMQQPITATLVSPSANISTRSINTLNDGSFTTSFDADEVGNYALELVFDGAEGYDGCSTTVNVTVQEKQSSSITLSCLPIAPAPGDTVTISGVLSPAGVATVSIQKIRPSGSSTTQSVTTNESGEFSLQTGVDIAGAWNFQANYPGSDTVSSCSRLLTVQVAAPAGDNHSVVINAGPTLTPATVGSGESTALSVSATDSQSHSMTYHWSDGGAGGTFSPSADTQSPTYTAAENPSGNDVIITLTCTVACSVDSQESDSGWKQLTVHTIDTTPPTVVSVTPSNGATCIQLDSSIIVTFSKAMDNQTVQNAVAFTPALESPVYAWSSDKKTLTISHAKMVRNTDYSAIVTTTAVDKYDIAMGQAYTWNFSSGSGAWFEDNTTETEVNSEFTTSRLLMTCEADESITLYIGVPDGVDVDTTLSADGLACVLPGADVSSFTSTWDSLNREIAINAVIANGGDQAEIVKSITLTAPDTVGNEILTLNGCNALTVTVEGPLPGDFNSDHAVNISDASAFITEWVKWHGTVTQIFNTSTDGIFDLAPHTTGVWPDWTPEGDQNIDIQDAMAFIDCWIGAHDTINPANAVTAASINAMIPVVIDYAPDGVFETVVQLPSGARFSGALDEYGNLVYVVRDSSAGGLFFSEYDKSARTIRIAGSVIGMPPYKVAVIRLSR